MFLLITLHTYILHTCTYGLTAAYILDFHVGMELRVYYAAQASHKGVKKITVTALIPEFKNFGVAIASRLAIAFLRTKCY